MTWVYWTSLHHLIVAIKKTIYLMVGWCSMGTFNDPNPYWLAPCDWLTSFQGWDPLELDIFLVPQTMQWLVITFPIDQGKSGYIHIIPYPWLLFTGSVMIFTIPDWNIPSLDTYPWANSLADDFPDGEILNVVLRMPRVFSVPIHPNKTSKYPSFVGPQEIGYPLVI